MAFDSDVDIDFRTTRRNLNLMSLLIFFLAFSQIQIIELNFLGLKMVVGNVSRLYIFIYFIYLYFLWRYLTKLNYKLFLKSFVEYARPWLRAIVVDNREKWLPDEIQVKDNIYRYRSFSGISETESIFSVRVSGNYRNNVSDSFRINLLKKIPVKFLSKLLRFVVVKDKFGDFVLPVALVLLNAVLFAVHDSWQGSARCLIGY